MSNYAPQVALALRLIKAKGQEVTLRRLTEDAPYDPVNPRQLPRTTSETTTGYGVVLPASNGTIEAFDSRILQDPAQLREFRFLILAASGLTFAPKAGDLIDTAAGTWRLLGATALDVNGTQPIIYNVGCTTDIPLYVAVFEYAAMLSEDGAFYFTTEDGTPLALD